MIIAFLIIISLAGGVFAFVTKQAKVGAGFVIFAIASALQIPNLVTGFWVDVFGAMSVIIYAVGVFVIIWQKKPAVSATASSADESINK